MTSLVQEVEQVIGVAEARLGRIAVLPHEDRVIVEDAGRQTVLAVSGVLGTERLPVAPGLTFAAAVLLGVSSTDDIYLGKLSGDGRRLVAVPRGKAGETFRMVWQDARGVDRDGLVVGPEGALYSVDQTGRRITELTGGRRTLRYRGDC